MSAMPNSLSEPRELGRLLVIYWRRWAVVALLVTVAAVAYALVAPKTWQASQALIVRNEAVGGETEPGKFRGAEDLKSIQETIIELSKGHSVLEAALVEVGPPADIAQPSAWPSDNDIESLQKAVKITPPKGVEFGSSEVFYLEVRDMDRIRVAELSSALSHQLQLHLQEIRDAKAQSMVEELNKAVQLAKSDLQAATAQLTALEKEVGSDLPELRSLLDSNSSDTSLRRTVSEIENELRQFRGTEKANRQLLTLLTQSQADPTRLMAAPTRLLDSQPALRRLKDGLVDAQLHTATLQGRMSVEHPEVISAKEAEAQVANRLHAELSTAIRGLESELAFDANRLEMLENQRNSASARLTRLAGLRATYTNILSEATNRAKLLDRAEQNLASARSNRASAKAASLITRVDAPDTGTSPVSPSKSMVVLGGLLGGLLTGLGIVLLTAPAATAVDRAPNSASTATAVAPQNALRKVLTRHTETVLQHATALAPIAEPWSLVVAAHGSLNCTQALKVLNEQGKLSSAALS
ncbi:MAG: Wzz/FepE/Etk N-terminal domain-containing protein [Thermoguttaceae bacterium]